MRSSSERKPAIEPDRRGKWHAPQREMLRFGPCAYRGDSWKESELPQLRYEISIVEEEFLIVAFGEFQKMFLQGNIQ